MLACPTGPLAEAAGASGVRVLPIRERDLRARGGIGARGRAAIHIAAHARELRRLVADLEPELLVAWGMRSIIATLALGPPRSPAPGRRLVLAHHDFLPDPVTAAAMRLAAARADAVVVNSSAVATDLYTDATRAARLVVIHPGVALAAEPIQAPAAPPEVLVLGAIVAWKRLDLALEACALARRSHPELRLRIVGAPIEDGGTLAGELRRRAARPDLAGAVEFPGPTLDSAAELARATCLLHCADREPFGLVIAEALAAERPVIVPDAAGPAEIVDDSCALRYPPGDTAAAAGALVALLDDPERAREMGRAGRARAARTLGREWTRSQFMRVLSPAGPVRHAPAPPPELALVTVTHNSAAELQALLDSVAHHLPGVRVIVVDCASADDSVEVARRHPAAVSIPAGVNLGFGRACNLGLEQVSEPVAVFVNPDVELLDDSLRALASELVRPTASSRLLAPLVMSPDGTRQDTVHPPPSSRAERLRIIVAPTLVPARLGTGLAPWRATAPRKVGWAVGCALGGRTATLRELGPFSNAIFMYGEDMELGLRAARQGVETWFWPQARVLHHQAHASARAYGGEPFARLAQARHDALAQTEGQRAAVADDRAQAALFTSRIAAKRLLGHDADRERRQLTALRAVRRAGSGDATRPT
jgi:GT2 family glycosyltransferase/glycosyltransferase involved in cell wall biosynthesis